MNIYHDLASAAQGGKYARAVARYNEIMQEVSDKAKKPGFTKDGWNALTEVVDAENFQRLGNFMEVQTWPEYINMLFAWGASTKFSSEFRRMIENSNDNGGIVTLELQENNNGGLVNSLSMYELNAEGKLFRLHIYLQMPMDRLRDFKAA
jgi:hypothetical protein